MLAGASKKAHRPLIDLDSEFVETRLEIAVFLMAQTVDRGFIGTIVRSAPGQDDLTRIQETFHPFITGLAIHIDTVVFVDIKGDKRPTGPLRVGMQIIIE